ncbi:MAG: gamma-glutamyltransferase [Acidimicrobiia bacterium]|nr:gamma-glutamyltransferase [Acidimicrobiia bacterium]
MSVPIAIAAPNQVAADAARAVVEAGGGAVDAAIAAAVAAMVSEPGVVSPGAGAFVTVLAQQGTPVVYDGYMAVPGLGGANPNPVQWTASMAYGGGVSTVVGPASVAVPGAWAAFGEAHRKHGRIAWQEVLDPVVHAAEEGTPLGTTSALYLTDSFEPIFSRDPAGSRALAPDGTLVNPGTPVVVEGLARSLRHLAAVGADDFYRGTLARDIARDLWNRGSHLSMADLEAFRSELRQPLQIRLGEWNLETNPVPAVGGAALAAILGRAWGKGTAELIRAQHAVYAWRRGGGDTGTDRTESIESFLQDNGGMRSASTAQVSTAGDGVVCAITLSAGYGSGIIPSGTGMWMNNGLGEVELVGDPTRLAPGTRLNSNMAPTVGRHPDGRMLAIGSPGADRITSALAQTLLHIEAGATADEAIAAPRVHVDVGHTVRVAYEPGVEMPPHEYDELAYDEPHMYFGGVGLAMQLPNGDVEAATDPRRNGVALVAG